MIHQTQMLETTVASTDKNESIILNINENTKHPVNENNGKVETSRILEDSEIINFTIKRSNVYNESNALATTNTTEQEKVEKVSKQMETTKEQEYTRLIMPQSKQQHEFNNKIEAEQIRITEHLNQIKSTIRPNETETQIAVMKREIERGLKDELSKFKEKLELSFRNEQKALQAQIELLKSENSSLKLQLRKLEGNTFNITGQQSSLKIPSDNKEIKNALKTIKETQENLKESVNTQRDDSSIISNKIKTV